MYKRFKRIFLVVLDSVGIGQAKDAFLFNDLEANTLLHTLISTNGTLPNLERMGLLDLIKKSKDNLKRDSYHMKASCISAGKDTLTGHLEMMGIKTEKPLKTLRKQDFQKN